MNDSPLQTALAASRPIDDAPRQPLAVELLLSESLREPKRITVEEHQNWRNSLAPQPEEEL